MSIPLPKKPAASARRFLQLATLVSVLAAAPLARAAWDTWAQPPYQDLTSDDAFYEDVCHRAWLYFIDRTNSTTGLTQDRSGVNGGENSTASVAASGWYLTALPIGVEHGWMSWSEANGRATTALRFFSGANTPSMPQTHGFFRHFVDKSTGSSGSEVSTIDTAILATGALVAGQYFGGDALTQANSINDRVEWNWMRTRGGHVTTNNLPMGYQHPDSTQNDSWGFIKATYGWSEAVTAYLIGLGTYNTANKLPDGSWNSLKCTNIVGYNVDNHGWLTCYDNHPIFIPQQPQNWFPLENRIDTLGQNYWDNAVHSTQIHRQFIINHRVGGSASPQYSTYGYHTWGLNACDHPNFTYAVDSAPGEGNHSGVICPSGAVESAPFCRDLEDDFAARAGRHMYDNYRAQIWGRYGFRDAYDLSEQSGGWWGPDAVGIDLGMMLCNVENSRTGLLWRILGAHPILYRAYLSAGLQPVLATATSYVMEPSHAPGKITGIVGSSLSNGAQVEQRTGNGGAAQQWQIVSAGGGWWAFLNLNSGKCMEVASSSTLNGGIVQQWDYVGGSNQQWKFVPAGSYSYAIQNRNSGLVLDVKGVSTADGATLQQWTGATNPQPNQIWKFYETRRSPLNLKGTAGAAGTHQVTLAWDPVWNGGKYDVWRATSSTGTLTKLNSSSLTGVTYTDTAPASGTYWYAVSANNGPAKGATSARISAVAP